MTKYIRLAPMRPTMPQNYKKTESDHSIMGRLMDFAISVTDFRRLDKGNIRHRLSDIIILIIMGRMTRHVSRVETIAFGNHNLRKLHSLGMFKKGIPSEPTLFLIEQGLDDIGMAEKMAAFMATFHQELAEGVTDIIYMDGKA